jgi:hypothetical protein
MYILTILLIPVVILLMPLTALITPLRQQSYPHSVRGKFGEINIDNAVLQNGVAYLPNSQAWRQRKSRLFVRPEDFASGKILKPLPFRGFPMPEILDEEDTVAEATKWTSEPMKLPEATPAKIPESAPIVAVETQKTISPTVGEGTKSTPEPAKSFFENLLAKPEPAPPKEMEPLPAGDAESKTVLVPPKTPAEIVSSKSNPAPVEESISEPAPMEETGRSPAVEIVADPKAVEDPPNALAESKPAQEPSKPVADKIVSKIEPTPVKESEAALVKKTEIQPVVVDEVKAVEANKTKPELLREDSKLKLSTVVESTGAAKEASKPDAAEPILSTVPEKTTTEKFEPALAGSAATPALPAITVPPSESIPVILPPVTSPASVTVTAAQKNSPSAIGLRLPNGPLEAAKAFGIPLVTLAVGRQILSKRNSKRKEIEDELRELEKKKTEEIDSLNNDVVVVSMRTYV